MKIAWLLALGIFAYTSYYYWLRYPSILDKLFRLKDDRLEEKLSKIWHLNINARALAIHKLMEKKHNQDYIKNDDIFLIKSYFKAKKYWYWSLFPLIVLIVISQFEQGYEILFQREQFQEKIDNSWFTQAFERLFK